MTSPQFKEKVQVWVYRRISKGAPRLKDRAQDEASGQISNPAAAKAPDSVQAQRQQLAQPYAIEFLLLKLRPERGGFWQPITGGVEPGEEIRTAAARETCEETGLQATVELVKPILGREFEFEKNGVLFKEWPFSFEMAKNSQGGFPEVKMDPREHVDFCWAGPQQVRQKVHFASNLAVFEKLLEG